MRTLAILLIFLVSGCAAAAAPAPREIRADEDVCAYCHMGVDDPARAAEWVEPDGRVHTFDEPGCLLAWMERDPDAAGSPFVADAAGSGWVAAPDALFVRGGAETGMGFGIVAYRDPAEARAAAAERGGEVRSWNALLEEGVDDAHAH